MNKIEINLDSTSLGTSACILEFVRTVIGDPEHPEQGAYRQKVNKIELNYGIACHLFVDTMYKTRGRYDLASSIAKKWFLETPNIPSKQKAHLSDPNHLIATCYNLWTIFIENDGAFEVLSLPGKCWWCKGSGKDISFIQGSEYEEYICSMCDGTGIDKAQAATEVTFSIPFYEDDRLIVNLCGTEDRIGKFKNGVYCIRDWKFTSSPNPEAYFVQYELSRQLRMYTLACKLMAELYPDSVMGQVGKTHMGAAIDGVFLNKNANDTKHVMSPVFQYSDSDIQAFKRQLLDFCKRLSEHIGSMYFPKEGIINGTCNKLYGGHCQFWVPCKLNEQVSNVILNRDFIRKPYDPLHFND
jgi:hypothetical protein